MGLFLGIDIGTSSCKAVAVSQEGKVVSIGQCEYEIFKPRINWAEQDINRLWEATIKAIRSMLSKNPKISNEIIGIGYSGQMHGLVIVDKNMNPLQNAIIWADQRTKDTIDDIYSVIPRQELEKVYCNHISTGFMLPSLVWTKNNRLDTFNNIYKVMLPKDYIRYKMCGNIGTDISDASGTGMWDMNNNTWSYDILEKIGISRNLLPEVHESYEKAGNLTTQCALRLGLNKGITISFGGGDSLMMGIGNGMLSEGILASTIGTGCHISTTVEKLLYDPLLRTNIYCHAKKKLWSVMGAHLNGGIALKWAKDVLFEAKDFEKMTELALKIPCGSEGVLFLPYLIGERTPYNDPNAKAAFLGLNLKHTKAHMIRSIMEGIVFSMKGSYKIIRSLGINADRVIAAGGGSKNQLFLQIQADMYNCPIYINSENEQAAIGAAITAAVCCSAYESYEDACRNMVHFSDKIIYPNLENVTIYEDIYEEFSMIYDLTNKIYSIRNKSSYKA